jgi:hypothetical protein
MKKNIETPNEKLNRLQMENEEKKKQLSDEFGADFGGMTGENELSPELENQFLDNILNFENAFQSAIRIKIYDFLEQPAFQKAEELSDAQIVEELDRLIELLGSKRMRVDTICDVDEREMYRFITEELFQEETDDIDIPGMFKCFTYEEFHPNHKYDIERHAIDFFHFYLNFENDFYKSFLTKKTEEADWHFHFRHAFSSFQVINFSIKSLTFDTEKAVVQFECDFVGTVEGDISSLRFEGMGEMKLLYQWDYWCIDSINLPKSTIC